MKNLVATRKQPVRPASVRIHKVFSFQPVNLETVGTYINHRVTDIEGNVFFIKTEAPPISGQINAQEVLERLAANTRAALKEFNQFVKIETSVGFIRSSGERELFFRLLNEIRLNEKQWIREETGSVKN